MYDLSALSQLILQSFQAIKTRLESDSEIISNKVTAEEGKGLSTNDLTNELKTKIDNMPNIYVGPTDPSSTGTVNEGDIWFRTE